MIETADGPLSTWTDANGRALVAAGDADCVAWFLDAQQDQDDWRCLGSVDQPDQIFVAARKSVPRDTLDTLALRGKRLLPASASWDDIGRDGLSLFTNDSGDVMLSLR